MPIYSPNCTLGIVWGWIISGPAFMLESMPLKSLILMALRYLEGKNRLLPQIHTTCLIGVLLTLSKWAKGRLAILVNRFLLALLGAGLEFIRIQPRSFDSWMLRARTNDDCFVFKTLHCASSWPNISDLSILTEPVLYRSGIKSRRRNIFNMQHSGCQNLLMMCILRF